MAKNVGTVSLGQWGGEGGNPWSQNMVGEIYEIYVTFDDMGINSVKFKFQAANGTTHESPHFGIPKGRPTRFPFDPKLEKVISIGGSVGVHNSVKRITSLTFRSAKNNYSHVGPIHLNKENQFECLIGKAPITGFYGRCGTVLDSIGVSIEVVKTSDVAGPWPARAGGVPWDYTSMGPICQISASYNNDVVRSLQFASKDASGVLHKSNIYGKPEGAQIHEINIDTNVEKINGISGAYGSYGGGTLVKAVTFFTNKMKSIGPFGTQKPEDTPFSFSVQGENGITGFYGRAGSLIDAIGVTMQTSAAIVGPFNGNEGNSWTYQPRGLITRIHVTYAEVVHTLQFESVDPNGDTQHSQVYGQTPGPNKITVLIEKDDKITNISGTTVDLSGWFITGMHITTKKQVYGPFGSVGKGITFAYPIEEGYISGFHGKSTHALKGLGVYVKPT